MAKTDGPSDAARTQVDAALAAAQRRYAGDPERAELIARTRRFKSSWIELAEALTECRKHERYRKWKYNTFEEYYRRELHLKAATVDKLTGSYAFLRKSAPEVMERDGVEDNIPSFQAVDFLRRAEEAAQSGAATEETVAEVRRAVMDDNMSLPKVSRLFKETLFPSEPGAEQKKRFKEAGKLARRLSEVIGTLRDAVPETVVAQVEQALAALLRSLPADKEEAGEAREAAA